MTTTRIIFALLLAATLTGCNDSTPSWAPPGYPACATEDSISCYYDATKRGDGKGRSFYTDADNKIHFRP
jgi:hypothetical protein